VPYLEPLMIERKFVRRLPSVYEKVRYARGLCPAAEEIQSKMMVFKTNYRSEELASLKAAALQKTIMDFKK